jgi:cytochrome c-type biogenesis protein CcmE
MRRRDQRLMMIGAAGAVLVLAATLTFAGLRDSVVYFVAPSDLAEKAEPGRRVRLGGLVVDGTVRRDADGATRFVVTDGAVQVEVRYAGVLPDLFR